MLGVSFVVVMPIAGLEVGRDLREDDSEDAVYGFLVGAVAVPDADKVVVEANGEREPAEVVSFINSLIQYGQY